MIQNLKSGKSINLGCRFDRFDQRDYIFMQAAQPKSLPARIDNSGKVTRIMNQNPEGACTGHAICATAEYLYWQKTGTKVDLSQRWAYRKARDIDEWPGENYHGSSVRAAMKAWSKFGMCEENFWKWKPYEIQPESPDFNLVEWEGEPEQGADKNALNYPVLSYFRCRNHFDIKRAIHEYDVVAVGAMVHSGWDIWDDENIKYDERIYELGGHAFIIVGYSEIEREYIIANSWGSEWGKNGIAHYSYKDAYENIHDAWVATVPDK